MGESRRSALQWSLLSKREDWMKKHDADLKTLAQSAKDNADATKTAADPARKSATVAETVSNLPTEQMSCLTVPKSSGLLAQDATIGVGFN